MRTIIVFLLLVALAVDNVWAIGLQKPAANPTVTATSPAPPTSTPTAPAEKTSGDDEVAGTLRDGSAEDFSGEEEEEDEEEEQFRDLQSLDAALVVTDPRKFREAAERMAKRLAAPAESKKGEEADSQEGEGKKGEPKEVDDGDDDVEVAKPTSAPTPSPSSSSSAQPLARTVDIQPHIHA